MGRLRIAHKLWIATLLLAVPAMLLAALSIRSGLETVDSVSRESAGLELALVSRQALRKAAEFTSQAAQAGAEMFSDQYVQRLAGLRGDVRYELTESLKGAIERGRVDGGLAGRLKAQAALDQLAGQWSQLAKSDVTLTSTDGMVPFMAFSGRLVEYQRSVAEATGLTTDPAADTAALLNALQNELPEAAMDLQEIRAITIMLAGRKAGANQPETAQLRTLTRSLRSHGEKVRRRLETAGRANEKLAELVKPLAASLPKLCNDYAGWVETQIAGMQVVTVEPRQVKQEGERASVAFFEQYDGVAQAARFALQARGAAAQQAQVFWVGGVVAVLALVSAVILLLNLSITGQVKSIQETFNRLSQGELAARAAVRSRDEMGELAVRLNHMLDQLTTLVQTQEERDEIQASIQRLLNEVSVVAEGDLTREAAVTADVTGAIADAFNYMTAELRGIIAAVQRITDQVNQSARTVQTSTVTLAENSSSQVSQISQAYQRIDEIARTSQAVSETSASAADVARQALRNAQDGALSVRATMEGMGQIRNQVQATSKRIKRLGETSQEIGEITQVIGDIADRTSILALNASIQAAMAGETGKGFAVVAEEVERLAERATEATKRIEALISAIQNETNEAITAMEATTREVVAGTDLANNAGQTLNRIESVSGELANLIAGISDAATRQSAGSVSVARAMNEISGITQGNARSARQAAEAVRGLAEQASALQSSLNRFRLPEEGVDPGVTAQWAAYVSKP
jgi:methyl-accepting chemotaxis protein